MRAMWVLREASLKQPVQCPLALKCFGLWCKRNYREKRGSDEMEAAARSVQALRITEPVSWTNQYKTKIRQAQIGKPTHTYVHEKRPPSLLQRFLLIGMQIFIYAQDVQATSARATSAAFWAVVSAHYFVLHLFSRIEYDFTVDWPIFSTVTRPSPFKTCFWSLHPFARNPWPQLGARCALEDFVFRTYLSTE